MGSGYESALMLAYIGYQADEDGLTRFGLDLAGERTTNDPLVAVLREIWLEKPAEERESEPAVAPSEPENSPEQDNSDDAPVPETPAPETQPSEEQSQPQK
jgi:hypothetical protein